MEKWIQYLLTGALLAVGYEIRATVILTVCLDCDVYGAADRRCKRGNQLFWYCVYRFGWKYSLRAWETFSTGSSAVSHPSCVLCGRTFAGICRIWQDPRSLCRI